MSFESCEAAERDCSNYMLAYSSVCWAVWFKLPRYHLKDVIVGKIYFLLVRIKLKQMELAIVRNETTDSGSGKWMALPWNATIGPCHSKSCALENFRSVALLKLHVSMYLSLFCVLILVYVIEILQREYILWKRLPFCASEVLLKWRFINLFLCLSLLCGPFIICAVNWLLICC